jgi:CRP-like cAMP-binding protein
VNIFGVYHSVIIFEGVDLRQEEPLMAPTVPPNKKHDFDPRKFLATIGEGRKVVAFPKKQTIFAQGDAADAVFYIQQGKSYPKLARKQPWAY